MTKAKFISVTSPAGIAKFPRLNEPDTKFAKAETGGKYTCQLILKPEEAKAIQAQAEAILEDFRRDDLKSCDPKTAKKRKDYGSHIPVEQDEDKDGNETGQMVIKCSANEYWIDKKTSKKNFIRVNIFDAKGKKIEHPPVIWGGSKLKLNFELVPGCWTGREEYGVQFRLRAVQVLELVTGNASRDAGDYGFKEEEEGFEAPADEDTMPQGDKPQDNADY